MKMEAETGVMWPQAQERLEEAGRIILYSLSRESSACPLLASTAGREQIPVAVSRAPHPV